MMETVNQHKLHDPIQLINDWQKPMYGLVFRMLGNEADAMDVTQEIFIKVIKKLQQYSSKGSFKSWMYQIGTRTVIDHIRSQKRRKQREKEAAKEMKTFNQDIEPEQKELEKEVIKQLSELPEEMRSMLILQYYNGLTQNEIAQVANIPTTTIQDRLKKALNMLKSNLQGVGCLVLLPNLEEVMLSSALPNVPSKLSNILSSIATQATTAVSSVTALTIGGVIMTKTLITGVLVASILIFITGFGAGTLFNEDTELEVNALKSENEISKADKLIESASNAANLEGVIQDQQQVIKSLQQEKKDLESAENRMTQENESLRQSLAVAEQSLKKRDTKTSTIEVAILRETQKITKEYKSFMTDEISSKVEKSIKEHYGEYLNIKS